VQLGRLKIEEGRLKMEDGRWKMGRRKNGKMERWKDGKMGRWEDEKVRRWEVLQLGSCKVMKFYLFLVPGSKFLIPNSRFQGKLGISNQYRLVKGFSSLRRRYD
jgi:hypothetical protein